LSAEIACLAELLLASFETLGEEDISRTAIVIASNLG